MNVSCRAGERILERNIKEPIRLERGNERQGREVSEECGRRISDSFKEKKMFWQEVNSV